MHRKEYLKFLLVIHSICECLLKIAAFPGTDSFESIAKRTLHVSSREAICYRYLEIHFKLVNYIFSVLNI